MLWGEIFMIKVDQRERTVRGAMRKSRTQEVREETSGLTLTSAFLFRRLLAAAERQKDTPSDGSVHIIQLLIATALRVCPRRHRCSTHAWAANLPALESTVNIKKSKRTCTVPEKKKTGTKIFPPSEKIPPLSCKKHPKLHPTGTSSPRSTGQSIR